LLELKAIGMKGQILTRSKEMAINIQSLFADIIDTPEQRQMKMLQEGMLKGDRLASGLTGLTRAAAPLAQVAGQLGVQRQ
jgi:hypothetical protein